MTDPHDTAPAAPSPSESLPEGWVETTLGELNFYNGGNLDPAEFPDEVFELYSVPNFPKGVPEFQPGKAIGSTKQTVQPDDVLVCKINPRINRVWKVNEASEHRQIGSSEWIAFRSPETHSDFFKHYFRDSAFRDLLCTDLTGVGGSLTRAQPKRVATFPLPLPPLPEQIRIADKLDALLSRVEAGRVRLERVPGLLKRFRQSVLSAAVSGELTREWRGGGDAEWEETSIRELAADIRYGTAQKCDYDDSGLPVLRIPNVSGGRISTDDLKYGKFEQSELKKLALKAGDILVIRSNGSADLVGQPALVSEKHAGFLFAGYLIRIRLQDKINPAFAWYRLTAPDIRSDIETQARSSSGVHNINTEELRQISFTLPPLPEQAEIVRRIEALFAIADRIEARYQSALTTFDRLTPALLAKAFRGELVPQDPNDEPASVLLERIRAARAAAGEKPKRGRGAAKGAAKVASSPDGAESKRRGRPPKARADAPSAAPAIAHASSYEDAVRRLEAQKMERAQGSRQISLFGNQDEG